MRKYSLEDLRNIKGFGKKMEERLIKYAKQKDVAVEYNHNVQKITPPEKYTLNVDNIYQGESVEFMRRNIPDNSIDMVLTSPPYDNLRDYNGFEFDYEMMLDEIYRVLDVGGVCVWVVGDATINGSETGTSFKQALYAKEVGFNLHDTMIWKKANPFNFGSNLCYIQSFEYMFVFSKGRPKTLNFIEDRVIGTAGKEIPLQRRRGDFMEYDNRANGDVYVAKSKGKRYNVWEISTESGGGSHPAVFPEELAEDHIISWSNEGDIVLDPMCGSGTTCKMAKLNNRRFIGIDVSDEYVELSKERCGISLT